MRFVLWWMPLTGCVGSYSARQVNPDAVVTPEDGFDFNCDGVIAQ